VAYPNNDDDYHQSDEGKNSTFEPSFTVLQVEAHLEHIAQELWMS
jgi:hypothetical protein